MPALHSYIHISENKITDSFLIFVVLFINYTREGQKARLKNLHRKLSGVLVCFTIIIKSSSIPEKSSMFVSFPMSTHILVM